MSDIGSSQSARNEDLKRRWINDPLVVLAGSLLLSAFALLGGPPALRVVLACILALFGPGWSLAAVLFPRRLGLDGVERLALAGILSLALGGLFGFLLARSPWGLRLVPLLAGWLLFNLVCHAAVWHRQRRPSESRPPTAPWAPSITLSWWNEQSLGSRLVTVTLLAFLGSGMWFLGQVMTVQVPDPPMTEFYLLDAEGRIDGLPQVAMAGESMTLRVGIANRESETAAYQVYAVVGQELAGGSLAIQLAPGQVWQDDVELQLPESMTGSSKIEIILLRQDRIHRRLHLWLELETDELHVTSLE